MRREGHTSKEKERQDPDAPACGVTAGKSGRPLQKSAGGQLHYSLLEALRGGGGASLRQRTRRTLWLWAKAPFLSFRFIFSDMGVRLRYLPKSMDRCKQV